MRDNETECIRCGEVVNKFWSHQVVTGRNIHYICPKCFKISGSQADKVTGRMVDAIKKGKNK